jgi:hypothetical protein
MVEQNGFGAKICDFIKHGKKKMLDYCDFMRFFSFFFPHSPHKPSKPLLILKEKSSASEHWQRL